MKRIVILGAGTGGTIMANRLAKIYRRELRRGSVKITLVDQDNRHVYQPGLLFLPFGDYTPGQITKTRWAQVSEQVALVQAGIDRVEPDRDVVFLEDGTTLQYDVLILATGTRLAPEETEGMLGDGGRTRV